MHQTDAGKGKRVAGVFIVLLGGGVLLESAAAWAGAILTAIGAAFLVWGFASMRDTQAHAENERSWEE